jgi:hypothetical protein
LKLFILSTILLSQLSNTKVGITYDVGHQVGGNVAGYFMAKILSLKYNIPFYIHNFRHSNIFEFDNDKSFEFINNRETVSLFKIRVLKDSDITDNLDKNDVLFWVDMWTKIDTVDESLINETKKTLQIKKELLRKNQLTIPSEMLPIAVHVRKGNGGGEIYDGEQTSIQLFEHDKNQIKYLAKIFHYPFEWESYTRYTKQDLDQVSTWQTKFPPDQYYIDQIVYLYKNISNKKLFVQIFTDDKNPEQLLEIIKNGVNKNDITFFYNKHDVNDARTKIARDLDEMSKFDILIRGQSYYARTAEMIGQHKIVICPISFKWVDKCLIMDKVIIKGSIENL